MAPANPDLSSQSGTSSGDPLASLYKMSTTAGLGSQDYVAVNVLSVVTAAIGLASGLVFLDNILLIIPVAGLVIGTIALVQIKRSAGTQTGTAWAVIGLLLCLGLAGYKFGNEAMAAARNHADEVAIEGLLGNLSENVVKPETTDKAYELLSEPFKKRVSLDLFKTRWAAVRNREILGDLQSIQSNGIVRVEPDVKTKQMVGVTGAIFSYSKIPNSGDRHNLFFKKYGSDWRIDAIPDFFPDASAQGQGD
jgi:hypothetical protein